MHAMDAATLSDELTHLCRRVMWWESPEVALREPRRLLTYVMAKGTWDDWVTARRHFTDDAFRAALNDPAPGVFDRKSWRYWHIRLGTYPEPPIPKRELP